MLIGQPGEKRVFARTRRRRVDDTKIYLEWTVCVWRCGLDYSDSRQNPAVDCFEQRDQNSGSLKDGIFSDWQTGSPWMTKPAQAITILTYAAGYLF